MAAFIIKENGYANSTANSFTKGIGRSWGVSALFVLKVLMRLNTSNSDTRGGGEGAGKFHSQATKIEVVT